MASFSILDDIEKIKKKFWILFRNIMENVEFAPEEQLLYFHNIFKYSQEYKTEFPKVSEILAASFLSINLY